MSGADKWRHELAAALVTTLFSNVITAILFLATGMIYFFPFLAVARLFKAVTADHGVLVYLLMYVGIPLAGVIFLRSPWRYMCMGLMTTNLALPFVLNFFGP